jgi:6-phosphogluconate dehydrogenase
MCDMVRHGLLTRVDAALARLAPRLLHADDISLKGGTAYKNDNEQRLPTYSTIMV